MSQISNNSRRGSQARHRTARLPSAAGYNDKPLVYSSLSFELWALPVISGRYVRASEDVYLSYLLVWVPYFVVQKFPTANYTPTAVNPCPPTYSNFVDSTDIGDLIHRNAYNVAVQEEPRALEATFMQTDGCATKVCSSRRANALQSSSMYSSTIEAPAPLPHIMPDRPNPQAVGNIVSSTPSGSQPPRPGPSHQSVTQLLAPEKATPTEPHPKLTHAPRPSTSSATGLPPSATPAPAPQDNKYMSPEIQQKCVDKARVEWVVPLPVACASRKSDRHFELAEFNDEPAWMFCGAKAKELGWHLHFSRYSVEEGVLDDDVFGAPVPRLPFFAMDGQTARPQRASNWMYRSRSPAQGDVGRRARTPPPTRLPWVPGCGPATKEGGDQSSKGKGKDVKFDDSDDSDEGMDLADVVTAPVATNLVVVAGLDDTLSAIVFEAIARDVLYRSGARPLAIVHARGQMWVRMEDAAGGNARSGDWDLYGRGYALDIERRRTLKKRRYSPQIDGYVRTRWKGAAQGNKGSSTCPSSLDEDLLTHSMAALSTELANLSVDPEVLGTFLATIGVPKHLLVQCLPSPSSSPPPEVRVPFLGVLHLITAPSLPSPPSPPKELATPTESRPPPIAPRAMMLPLSAHLMDSPGPRPLHRIPLLDRLREPTVPLEQRLTNPLLATCIGNQPLRDRVDPTPPSDVSRKRYHDELDDAPSPPSEPEPIKKKMKMRGLHLGKDQQKRRKSKAVCKERAARQGKETRGDINTAGSSSSQPLASSSRVQFEDLEDGKISDSAFWEDKYEQDGT
ncbi:hypothetical protein DFH08DRAFT_816675 [Mycena albidolilacea]|uniref:Uncharacterized protein n=1 Tax=Mycena albidolilacea TaxID=1033008 RepID=A0AAD7EJD6_9AGAR|nr:hypothetical protein DFH08DRAFT_816675 [Mycena albidolilacea]